VSFLSSGLVPHGQSVQSGPMEGLTRDSSGALPSRWLCRFVSEGDMRFVGLTVRVTMLMERVIMVFVPGSVQQLISASW
jgi:hypothetical protein